MMETVEKMKELGEIKIKEATVQLVSQEDLSIVAYALHMLEEDEKDEAKKASFKRVQDALDQITNFYGTDALGSYEVLKEYGLVDKDTA